MQLTEIYNGQQAKLYNFESECLWVPERSQHSYGTVRTQTKRRMQNKVPLNRLEKVKPWEIKQMPQKLMLKKNLSGKTQMLKKSHERQKKTNVENIRLKYFA